MADRLEERISEIKKRTKKKRQKLEDRVTSVWAACSVCFMISICMILGQVKMPGIAAVANGYSSVLLRDGASGYVVTAIIAFMVGMTVTIICIRYRKKKQNQLQEEKELGVCLEKKSESI